MHSLSKMGYGISFSKNITNRQNLFRAANEREMFERNDRQHHQGTRFFKGRIWGRYKKKLQKLSNRIREKMVEKKKK